MRILRQNPHEGTLEMTSRNHGETLTALQDDPAGARTQDLRIKSAPGIVASGNAIGRHSRACTQSARRIHTYSSGASASASAKKPSTPKPLRLGGSLTWGGR